MAYEAEQEGIVDRDYLTEYKKQLHFPLLFLKGFSKKISMLSFLYLKKYIRLNFVMWPELSPGLHFTSITS